MFENKSLCYDHGGNQKYTICGCKNNDVCNDPTSPASDFEISKSPILEEEYKKVISGNLSDSNETVSIHPTFTLEMDTATSASVASVPETSSVPENATATSAAEELNTQEAAVDNGTNQESVNATSAPPSSETSNESSETANDPKISVLPSDDLSEESNSTENQTLSAEKELDDEPISMKNMTAVGEVTEAKISENSVTSGDEKAGVDATTAETPAEITKSSGTLATTIKAKEVPVASASVSSDKGAKTGSHFFLSLAVVAVPVALFLN
ncbi:hypothetical protein L596_002011 [Steinernema carpocapsae]|nr:hypothetical protein L596_002011 [Steinernema carpocapsae]